MADHMDLPLTLYQRVHDSGAGNLARAQTARTNSNGLRSAFYHSLNLANVGLPHSVRLTMRVGDVLTEHDALSANTAFCHL